MKKIDLHIHTVPTFSDSHFQFSLDTFKAYVEGARLDAVAVTNHDMFDCAQFMQIAEALKGIAVFPGIEVNVAKGHVLIFGDRSELDDFDSKARLVSARITKVGDCISVDDLKKIFGDLSRYLVIPHCDKTPPLAGDALEELKPYVAAGEVDSAKKFVRAIKDSTKFSPVLFSDARMKESLTHLPVRQTFVDCGDITLGALKTCLRDKAKVALSESDGNRLWCALPNGQMLSTGLNVMIGARSTGKTYTLDGINEAIENTKYIRQFSLVQESEAEYRTNFEKGRSIFVDQYLSGLKRTLDQIVNVNLASNDRQVEQYLETLRKSADEADRRDAFSKATLFDEDEFSIGNTTTLQALIESVRQLVENVEFRSIIIKHIDLMSLKKLAVELIAMLHARTTDYAEKAYVNGLIKDVKAGLKVRTAATQVSDVDLYRIAMDKKRVDRFVDMVALLKQEKVISLTSIQGFQIEAKRQPFGGAMEVKAASGVKTAFSDAFREYASPYEYLQGLLLNEAIPRADLYKLFAKISYRILNKDGFEVSGGERSEFRLLQEIADAQNYDLLLIDEPESSFDNLFLKSDVNQLLKAISSTMPVVIVTHNNTVGASIGADYLLYSEKSQENGTAVYRIYSGYPSDKQLKSYDGREIVNRETMMNSLEAGVDTYESRRELYEALKN